jgi:hypothetical protein
VLNTSKQNTKGIYDPNTGHFTPEEPLMKYRKLLASVGVVLSLGLYAWGARFMIWAAGNYWAAGGPPNPNSEPYLDRGKACVGLAMLLFVAATAILVLTIRRYRRSKPIVLVRNSPTPGCTSTAIPRHPASGV